MAQQGVLPIQTLERLFDAGFITGVDKKRINPDAIDLPVSKEAYRIDSIFQLRPGERVESVLKQVNARPFDFSSPMERGVPYLFRVEGQWRLPRLVHGYGNPRSSIGRVNLFSRIIADGVPNYDSVKPCGWQGSLWILARADSFPVLMRPGEALSQLRLFEGRGFIDELEMEIEIEQHGLLYDREGKALSLDSLRRDNESVICSLYVGENMGYECRSTQQVLDLGNAFDPVKRTGGHNPADFFEPISARNGSFILRKGVFYILSTQERVKIPPHLAGDLSAIEPRLGDFRSHAAGYIGPGWGCGKDGRDNGREITLEVIPHEDTLVRPGQAIAVLRFDRMRAVPHTVYATAGSSYVNQSGATLSKFFQPWA